MRMYNQRLPLLLLNSNKPHMATPKARHRKSTNLSTTHIKDNLYSQRNNKGATRLNRLSLHSNKAAIRHSRHSNKVAIKHNQLSLLVGRSHSLATHSSLHTDRFHHKRPLLVLNTRRTKTS